MKISQLLWFYLAKVTLTKLQVTEKQTSENFRLQPNLAAQADVLFDVLNSCLKRLPEKPTLSRLLLSKTSNAIFILWSLILYINL